MKLKYKIFSLTGLVSMGAVVAPIALTSCNPDKQKDKEQQISTVKLNTAVSPDDIEMTSDCVPFTMENTSTAPAYVQFNVPEALGVEIFYREPSQTTRSGWTTWENVSELEYPYNMVLNSGYKYQFAGYCSSSPGKKFSNATNQINVCIQAKVREYDEFSIDFGGNICSLLSTQDPKAMKESPTEMTCANVLYSEYEFKNLFAESEHLCGVSRNLLPFKNVTKGCYEGMFKDCENLLTAPALIATENYTFTDTGTIDVINYGLTEACYKDMFNGCSKLVVAPELPAILLAKDCYNAMFKGCTGLNNISLGYIGNFESTYFTDWVNGVTNAGEIRYNGLDTTKSVSALPSTFTKIATEDEQWLADYTKDIVLEADTSSEITGKSKRVYTKYQLTDPTTGVSTLASLTLKDITPYLPTYKAKINGQSFLGFYKEGSEDPISETTKVAELPAKMIPKYGTNIVAEQGYCNVIVESGKATLTLRYGYWESGRKQKTRTNKFQYAKQNATSGEWEWTTFDFRKTSASSISIDLDASAAPVQILLKGNGANQYQSWNTFTQITITNQDDSNPASVRLAGTIGSLYYNGQTKTATTAGTEETSLVNKYQYYSLFKSSSAITSVDEGFLPATTLTDMCYAYMFYDCKRLQTAPKLPAMALFPGCYANMFGYNESLTTAPDLPATTLPEPFKYTSGGSVNYRGCYDAMFHHCINMTTAPTKLEATTVPDRSYHRMFDDCWRLTNVPVLSATEFEYSTEDDTEFQYENDLHGAASFMFAHCYSLTDISKVFANKIKTLAKWCFNSMFKMEVGKSDCSSYGFTPDTCKLTTGCQVLVEDSVTTIPAGAYDSMFYQCKKVTSNFPTTLGTNVTTVDEYGCCNMFFDCELMKKPLDMQSITTITTQSFKQMYAQSGMYLAQETIPETGWVYFMTLPKWTGTYEKDEDQPAYMMFDQTNGGLNTRPQEGCFPTPGKGKKYYYKVL